MPPNSHFSSFCLYPYSVWYPQCLAPCLAQLRTQYQFVEFQWALFHQLCIIPLGQCVLETALEGRVLNISSSFSCIKASGAGENLDKLEFGSVLLTALKKYPQSCETHLQNRMKNANRMVKPSSKNQTKFQLK